MSELLGMWSSAESQVSDACVCVSHNQVTVIVGVALKIDGSLWNVALGAIPSEFVYVAITVPVTITVMVTKTVIVTVISTFICTDVLILCFRYIMF